MVLNYQFRDYQIGQEFLERLGFWIYQSCSPPFGFGWVDIDEGIIRPSDKRFFNTAGNSPVVANLERDGRLHGIRGINPPSPYDYYETIIANKLKRLEEAT
ncbi:MAG: hypothetical protein PHF67_03275 [Candidatus Nanoarchaeia archaeon]|nr:hypothetical protein [Candidatus Nanoarchaeia archaeon]